MSEEPPRLRERTEVLVDAGFDDKTVMIALGPLYPCLTAEQLQAAIDGAREVMNP